MRANNGSHKASEKSRYWLNLIQQQSRSGQSVNEFCSEWDLTEQSFYGWRKRLSKAEPVSFALVTTGSASGSPGTGLELEIGPGRLLRIPSGVDAATLRTVLGVLREQP